MGWFEGREGILSICVRYGGYFKKARARGGEKYLLGKQAVIGTDPDVTCWFDIIEDIAEVVPWQAKDSLRMSYKVPNSHPTRDLASFSSELLFYMGLGIFIYITKRVQQPYYGLGHCWLIADHNSYLYSSYLTMRIKVFAPLLVAYLVWPVIGLPAAIAVAPFLLGPAVHYAFEECFQMTGSSCWPILPIVFEVYRLYQLNKGAHFVERLLFSSGRAATHELLERSALVSLLVVFQALGLVCIWCLATFILWLHPAEPTTES